MKKNIIIILVVLLTIISLIIIKSTFIVYEWNYFDEAGVDNVYNLSDAIERKGEPLKIDYNSEKKSIYAYYDGMYLRFDAYFLKSLDDISEYLSHEPIACIVITGKQYRFGLWNVGVGTSRKELERVYKYIRKQKDVDLNEWFGIIDGSTWVSFYFDSNDCVSKIYIARSPT